MEKQRCEGRLVCVSAWGAAGGEYPLRKGTGEKFWMVGLLQHRSLLFNCNLFPSVQCQLHFKRSVKLCLGLGGNQKTGLCSISGSCRPEREVSPGQESPGEPEQNRCGQTRSERPQKENKPQNICNKQGGGDPTS